MVAVAPEKADDALKNIVELATTISQPGDFRVKARILQSKVTELETQVSKLAEEREKVLKERNKPVAECRRTVKLALHVTSKAFNNDL